MTEQTQQLSSDFDGLMTGEEVRVRVDLTNGGHIIAVFPPHGDAGFEKAKKELLNSRFEQRGRKTRNVAADARIRFFNSQCQRIDGWRHRQSDGTVMDAMQLADWKQRFPTELKVSIVAENFEERETLSDEDQEDFGNASGEA